jgi:hypothetical protein
LGGFGPPSISMHFGHKNYGPNATMQVAFTHLKEVHHG